MKAAIISGCVTLSVLAASAAHAAEDWGSPMSPLIRPRLWSCGSYVLLEPNDPIWKTDRVGFKKGTLSMSIRDGSLTVTTSKQPMITKCIRTPLLVGDPLPETYFLQTLGEPLVF
jgi:hypothetical protein